VVTFFDESVQGLDVGAPVKIRGVTIGHVSRITIAPDHRHVEVHADIYQEALERLGLRSPGSKVAPEEPLAPPGVRKQVVSTGITGNKFLELNYFDPRVAPAKELPFETPWNTIPAAPSTLKSLEEGVFELMDRLPPVLAELRALLVTTRRTLEELDAPALVRRTESLMDQGGSLLEELEGLARDLRGELQAAELARTAAAVREAASAAGEAARSTGEAAGRAGALAREAGRLPALLAADLLQLRETLEAMETLARLVERDPGVLLRGRTDSGEARQ